MRPIAAVRRIPCLLPVLISSKSARWAGILVSDRVILHSMLDTCRRENTLHHYQPFRIDGNPFRFIQRFSESDPRSIDMKSMPTSILQE